MSPLQRLAGTASVLLVTGLTLAGIVFAANLIATSLDSDTSDTNFQALVEDIVATDDDDDAASSRYDWDSTEEWKEMVDERRHEYSITRVYLEDGVSALDCSVDSDHAQFESVTDPEGNVTVFTCADDDTVIYIEGNDLDVGSFGPIRIFPDDDADPSLDEDPDGGDNSNRQRESARDLLESIFGETIYEDDDLFAFFDDGERWTERDDALPYGRGRSLERWSSGPFTFEYGGPNENENFEFKVFGDGDWFGFEEDAQRFGMGDEYSGPPYTFRFRDADDGEQYFFDFRNEDELEDLDDYADRFSFDETWTEGPFSFRYRSPGDDGNDYSFDFFDRRGDGDDREDSFRRFEGEIPDPIKGLFERVGPFAFGGEMTPEQQDQLRETMQRMMQMFMDGDWLDAWQFHDGGSDSDPDGHHDDGDDADGSFSFHDSDSAAGAIRY